METEIRFYMDFCPSEHIQEATPNPNATFVSSACIFYSFSKDSKSKIKKFSGIRGKDRRMHYLKEITKMVKQQEIDFLSLCLVEDKESHYENGLLNTKGRMDKILSTDVGRCASKDQIASTSGVLFSVYASALYFLLVMKLYGRDLPQYVEIIIDRLPRMVADNLELFKVIQETCYNHIFPHDFYKGTINIRVLEKNEEDPPGLIIADMMAHIYRNWVTLENVGEKSNIAKEQAEGSEPEYTNEHYLHFAAFNNYLVDEKECLVVITPTEMDKVYNMVRRGIMSGEEFSEIISNFQKGEKS